MGLVDELAISRHCLATTALAMSWLGTDRDAGTTSLKELRHLLSERSVRKVSNQGRPQIPGQMAADLLLWRVGHFDHVQPDAAGRCHLSRFPEHTRNGPRSIGAGGSGSAGLAGAEIGQGGQVGARTQVGQQETGR